uniref:Laminin subunit alpha 1 n=1 Tax=Denticeps clupeoides TaxID=299321 RepID=A0AAY4A9F9_9TELE
MVKVSVADGLLSFPGLFPAILNLASNAEITTNATCGDPEPEMYCKLVEHVPGRRIHNPQCRICDGSSANPKEQHPITYAIDGTNRWWQSPSIKNGRQFHWVTITLDLRQIFQVAYIIIKAANSPRPGNWILERSLDGKKFEPWQYYAISDTECLTRYNITPRLGPPTYKRDDEVICTSYYSRLVPLEHGEIHTSLINGRPSADDLTPELLEFTSARYIRLRLQRIRTLNADLMTLSYRDPKDVDPIVTRRYYYSIKDISVGGMCICYGHAQSCPLDPETRCKCEHNTCGESCNECCPGYHQQPWQPGTISAGNTCEKCNCHSKAGDCYYNRTVAEQRRSMNVHGQYVGGGVCINCTQNTAGVNCETCADGFFRPHKVSPYSESPCVDCNCDMRGSLSPACIRDDNHAQPERGLNPGQCLCKEGFAGERCDRCAFGYRDFPLCTFCECSLEGSLNIDPCTECICKANVMGANCDLCKRGFYNLQASNPEGCTECFCFGVSDVFRKVSFSFYGFCRLSTVSLDVANPDSTTHLQAKAVEQCECPWGYSGTSCEVGSCEMNLNTIIKITLMVCGLAELDLLNPQGCKHNTTGPHCDQCLPGFYGDPSEGTAEDCQRCACPLTVASNNFSPTCSLESSGEMTCDQCQQGYTGQKCERCGQGYHGNPSIPGEGCVLCECNGNVDTLEPGHCDPNSGECLKCMGYTSGPHCERCQDGYYGDAITAKNCQACGCHGNGSSSSICDIATGQCVCKPHVVGEKCDRCEVGFHSLSRDHCIACNCSQSGSTSTACDEEGRCQCVAGVTGDKCDHCDKGYYNFQKNGCTACDCEHTHGNCDPDTGVCICPPHTKGEKCELCEEDHWGHDGATGCKPCNCSVAGVTSTQCDLASGQCSCAPAFDGQKCDHCALGFRNFPECTACDCNPNGTREEFCDEQLGLCGCEDQGSCVCKVSDNVGGRGCDECKRGTFGLSVHNPAGCSACFCFGVSSECEELGGLIRVPVSKDSFFTAQNTKDTIVSIQKCCTLSSLAGPHYWRLPKHFQGNKLLSYGGKLSYVVNFFALDGEGLVNFEPQVLIRGGHLKKSVIFIDMPAPKNGFVTHQEVPLTEHQWKYFNSVSEKAVSHSDFMSVLSNVEYVLIKASYGTDLQQSRITNITMETAIEADEVSGDRGAAQLVESCECPPGYAGLSCQECAPGYFRQPLSELNMKGKNRPLIQPCVPCQCNNHSLACDLDNGKCLGCQHNTAGEYCNVCVQGYYGKVKGSINDCSLCACPLQSNSFSTSCVSDGVGDYRCDACKPGYEGRYCERCAVGYYGNPSEPGGRCEPCQCSGTGSLHQVCDSLTGKCECKVGVTGHTCDECEARHVLIEEQCVSCDDECTGALLDDVWALEGSINAVNLTGVILAPYSVLVSLEKEVQVRSLTFELQQNLSNFGCRGKLSITEQLFDRMKPLRILGENLSRNLSEIKEMISQARKQAASIKVAVSADRDCVRAYRPEISSSNVNTITLTVKTSEPDNLLFYMGSSSTVDFMALEMHRGKVAFLWDTGSGHTKLEYPDVAINNNKWHWINATRFGKQASLAVHQLDSAPMPAVKATAPGSSTVLDINKTTWMFVGGLSGQVKKSSAVKMTDFKGCMGEASLNEKNIGLWNFAEREGQCRGCFMSPQAEETSFNFDGSGYSVVEKSLRPTATSIIMLFKTLAPNGLLLYLASNGTVIKRDFLSIELVEGKVRVTFELGSGPLTMTSTKAYNTGIWYKIAIQRNKRKAVMAADNPLERETIEAESPGLASDLNRSDLDPIYIGGLPKSRPIRRQVVAHSFVGCIKNMEIARTNFDLLRDSYGVKKGCVVKLPPMTLSPQTELMATFSTKNDSGIILVGFAKSANRMRRQTHQPFLAVMLVSGKLEVHVNMAEGGSVHKAVIKSQKGTFGDGLEHSLVLQRNKRCVSLCVLLTASPCTATLTESHQFGLSRNSHMIVGFRNRTLSLRTFAPSGILYYMANGNQQDYAVLQLQGGQLFFTCDLGKGPAVATLKKPINDGIWHTVRLGHYVGAHIKGHTLDVEGKLHLGGIPAEYTARRIGNVTHSIAGCVQGVMLNGLKLNTQKPASSYATGACFSSAQEGSFFNGSGHAAFSKEGYVVGSDVTVSLEFRSTAPDGTLLGISSTKVDAIGLELVVFNVNNGAGRISSTSRSSRPLCDGHWHTMVAKKFKNSLSVTVDGHTVTTPNPYSSSTSAETKNPIYVGGYPAEVKQNCLTARAAFQGCMRNLRVYKGHVTDVLDFSTAFHLSGVFPNSCPGNPA